MLEAVIDVNIDLRRQAVPTSINRGTDDGREGRLDQGLPADHHKDALAPRIEGRWVLDPEQLAAPQGMTW
jgi:hypothetical protein